MTLNLTRAWILIVMMRLVQLMLGLIERQKRKYKLTKAWYTLKYAVLWIVMFTCWIVEGMLIAWCLYLVYLVVRQRWI